MPATKETVELLRMIGVLTAKVIAAKSDGFSRVDGLTVVLSCAGYIYEGLVGMVQIPSELKDLDELEFEQLIGEIVVILRRSGKFTHRERDVAERILRLAFHNIREVTEIRALPPSAELVESA